jgi:putative redox protein
MLEAIIKLVNGVRFEAAAGTHTVVCDQPLSNSGTDAGMSPPEFLLVSLGTCAGFYAAQYLKARSLAADGLTVRVGADKAQGPARLGSFRIEVNVPGLTDERHKEGVMRAVKTCLIHNTLTNPPAIEMALNTEPAALTA